MDCMPMDTVCELQRDFDAQYQEIVIEDKAKDAMVVLGTFNGRTYILSLFDKQYIIGVFDKNPSIPPEMF